MKKIVIVDGHSILNRAFYGLPDLTNSEGVHTNAVLGFLNIVLKLLEEEQPTHFAVAFDVSQPTFRHERYEAYKGTRKPMAEELRQQVPLIKEVLESMGVTILEKPGYEADDVIGTIAALGEKEGFFVTVLSGDRDLLQLATEKVQIKIPKTKERKTVIESYFAKEVEEVYGVTPEEFIDVKGLQGDTSDNIPGIPGVGEKTAAKIIKEYHTIENAYAHIEEIKPNKARESLREYYDQAILSKELATICTQCPVEFQFETAKMGNLFTKEAYEIFRRLEFKSLLKKFENEPAKVELRVEKVTDLARVEELFEEAYKKEVVGLEVIEEEGECLGVSFSLIKEVSYVMIPEGFLTKEFLLEKVHALCQKQNKISFVNLKRQLEFLEVTEEDTWIYDCMVADYLLRPNQEQHDYDAILKNVLGEMVPTKEELIGKLSLSKALEEKEEAALNFCGYQSYTALATILPLMEKLKETGMDSLYREIEMPTLFALYDMEKRGIGVEKEQLKNYGEKLGTQIKELEQKIYQLAGHEFNINSPKQLGEILFEELGLPNGKKTKTGYSTSVDVLEKLIPHHEIIQLILDYRHLAKLKSTYADGLAGYIKEDGRIHGKFNQTITATGRISSTDPNLQNIPMKLPIGREIRKVFVPQKDYVFVDADYSQIELRLLAHLSEDESLIQAFRDNQDIHATTAAKVCHVPIEQVTKEQRRDAKAVNFGIIYGISAFGLSRDLNISRKQAQEYIDQYFETYGSIKAYLDGMVEEAKNTGKSVTMFGRIRPIPEISSSNFMQRNFGERIAMNSPIQGGAADIMKIAMFRVNMRLKKQNMKSRLILQVHDELLVEAHKDEVEEVVALVKEEMMHAADLKVPLLVEACVGNDWYEAK